MGREGRNIVLDISMKLFHTQMILTETPPFFLLSLPVFLSVHGPSTAIGVNCDHIPSVR